MGQDTPPAPSQITAISRGSYPQFGDLTYELTRAALRDIGAS